MCNKPTIRPLINPEQVSGLPTAKGGGFFQDLESNSDQNRPTRSQTFGSKFKNSRQIRHSYDSSAKFE